MPKGLVIALVFGGSLAAPDNPWAEPSQDREAVSLCAALERLEPGDRIPAKIAGIYSLGYFYDPEHPTCRLDIRPTVCIDLPEALQIPAKFKTLYHDQDRVAVTFAGILHGRPLVPETHEPDLPLAARLARNPRFCANRYLAKFEIQSIDEYHAVPEDHPWLESSLDKPSKEPLPPIELALPVYPQGVSSLHLEGSVLIDVEVVNGEVIHAAVVFGDPLLAAEALNNVRTWRFGPTVTQHFTAEYDYRLEKRPPNERNARQEMRLPIYVRVTAPEKGW